MGTRGLGLDGDWLLSADPGNVGRAEEWFRRFRSNARPARVPGVIQEVLPDYHGIAWYWTEFTLLDNPHPNGRIVIQFGAVDYLAEVWLNGVPIGGHEGGETPFELDATAAFRPGAVNLLAVRVLNPTNQPIDGFVLAQTPHRNKSIPPVVGGGYTAPAASYSAGLLPRRRYYSLSHAGFRTSPHAPGPQTHGHRLRRKRPGCSTPAGR